MSTDAMSREETLVLETFRRLGKPIGEDQYHMLHQVIDFAGRGLGFEYNLTYWNQVDARFTSQLGAVPYSSRLHEIIEGLVERKQLQRNPKNPIELQKCSN